MSYKGATKGLIFLMKTILVILIFVVFMVGILVFLLLIGTVTGSGICNVIAEVNQGNVDILNDIQLSIQENQKQLIRECIPNGVSGQLRNFILTNQDERNAVRNTLVVIDGLNRYRKWLESSTQGTASSVSIQG